MMLPLIVRLSRWRAGSRYAMAMLMRTPSIVLRALGETPVDSWMVLVRIIAKVGVNTGPVKGHGLWHPLVPLIAAYWNWAGLAVEFPTTIVVVFHLAEIRQYLLIGPFGVAPRGPVVIILRNATVQHLPIEALEPPVALPRGIVSRFCCGVSCAT